MFRTRECCWNMRKWWIVCRSCVVRVVAISRDRNKATRGQNRQHRSEHESLETTRDDITYHKRQHISLSLLVCVVSCYMCCILLYVLYIVICVVSCGMLSLWVSLLVSWCWFGYNVYCGCLQRPAGLALLCSVLAGDSEIQCESKRTSPHFITVNLIHE